MTKTEKMLKLLPGLENTKDAIMFARYLESKGKRFLVDFGTENAREIAAELLANEDWEVE